MHLAAARLAAGNVAEVRRAIETALASSWRSTPLFVTAYEVYVAAKDTAQAGELRATALEHNPRAFD